jgi:hypothetical protein
MRNMQTKPPLTYFAYIGGVALLVIVGALVPSEVDTTYSWQGVGVELVLLLGLWLGSNLCRWILIALGIAACLGSIFIQSTPLEFAATLWAVLALLVTGLLVTRAMRAHTHSSKRFALRAYTEGE